MADFFKSLFGRRKVKSTSFSDFIRNASAGEKKRVYTEVLKKATERQLAMQNSRSRKQDDRPQT